MIKAVSLFLVSFLLLGIDSVSANEVDLRTRILQATPGQWVRMKSPGGIETTTLVSSKDKEFLTIEVHTFRKKRPQSWVQQVYRLKDSAIVECRVKYPDGTVEEIPVSQVTLWIDIFKNKEYQFVKKEEVKVPAGSFEGDHYRTIVQDNLIHLWLSDGVPVTGLVKSRFRGGSSLLIGYGNEGMAPVFP